MPIQFLCGQSSSNTQTGSAASTKKPASPQDYIEVVATKIPEAPDEVPSALEVISGDDLRSRGATDLATALSLAAGVEIGPGGDGGPASSVPEFWGLREFDAFLLVVDGVPWGGAFNPALSTLSLYDVERIEILRGPAPVTYGATSFVGVIEVIRKPASTAGGILRVHGGNFGTGGVGAVFHIPLGPSWDSRLALDADRVGFRDDRTSFRRGHLLFSAARNWDGNRFWFNFDAAKLDQDPASPHPRQGRVLSPLVPLDANHNPAGAFLNDWRGTFWVGFDKTMGTSSWSSTFSASRQKQGIFRGFLLEPGDEPVSEARGIRENIELTDLYADSHYAWKASPSVTLVAGADFSHGSGDAEGADFDYDVELDGRTQAIEPQPNELDVKIEDRRNFFGAYLLAEWQPLDRLKLTGGIRLSATHEEREFRDEGEPDQADAGPASQTNVRPGGSAGILFTAWENGDNRVRLYANYRDTFKPAAIDFGIGEGEEGGGEEDGLLEPETARSYEGGLKALLWNSRLRLDASVFLNDFRNLVLSQTVNGVPGLINGGTQRFKGFEVAAGFRLPYPWNGRATYSFHDAVFRDYVQEFDGVPTQLSGNRLELSARNLASAALFYAPERGPQAAFEIKYVGSRYLNRRNSALADGFTTVGVSGGYSFGLWEIRVHGRNLSDERPPVTESELGDAQYYLLPARTVDAELIIHF